MLPKPATDSTKSPADIANVAKTVAATDASSDAAKTLIAKAGEQGTVSLRIDPWGEVFVNGRTIGVSPPLKQHKLTPGKYKIEIKNGTFTPYVTNIEVRTKENVAVKYRFQ